MIYLESMEWCGVEWGCLHRPGRVHVTPYALAGLSYAGWIGCFSSPAATIGPAGLFLLGRGPGSLLTAAVW